MIRSSCLKLFKMLLNTDNGNSHITCLVDPHAGWEEGGQQLVIRGTNVTPGAKNIFGLPAALLISYIRL